MAAIIFDFDGTIANSFNYVADFLALEAGLPPLSDHQKRELRGLSMPAMARRLGYHWWRLPGLFMKGRSSMRRAVQRFKTYDGMDETIRKLHAEGHELFIVSSNTVRNIHLFLRAHHLHVYFLQVYGGVNLFGKAPVLRQLTHDHHLEIKDCVYVGDELRDVQAAQSLELRVIAVTWGFAKPSELAELRPTALADKPADLLELVQ